MSRRGMINRWHIQTNSRGRHSRTPYRWAPELARLQLENANNGENSQMGNNDYHDQQRVSTDHERRFNDASKPLRESVQRHMNENADSSEEEQMEDTGIVDKIVKRYQEVGGEVDQMSRTKHFLEEALNSGSASCLICMSSIKRADAIWPCDTCYTIFHLTCIHQWCTKNMTNQAIFNEIQPMLYMVPNSCWHCPVCRTEYTRAQVPEKYKCFCKKVIDPPVENFMVPHSCGEICKKPLSNKCGHCCLLLCHPGPCPPCPSMVMSECFCKASNKMLRCSSSQWSCGEKCGGVLNCTTHYCTEICHEGPCPQCPIVTMQQCMCGSNEKLTLCAPQRWQCDRVCGKTLPCKHHFCTKVCHTPIPCSTCPLTGWTTCPCGLTMRMVTCPEQPKCCELTCSKLLSCGEHHCPNKCHEGPCKPCVALVSKTCECRAACRLLPCNQDHKCKQKCRRLRSCSRHPCSRRCCKGDCPPCERICGRDQQCGQHKCQATCHQGPCYPCARMTQAFCNCKSNFALVPCGYTVHGTNSICFQPCRKPYACGHDNLHICHFGDCPPCTQICTMELACKHKCKAECHFARLVTLTPVVQPSTPCERQLPKKIIRQLDCPPCNELVTISCLGKHEETQEACHFAQSKSCGRKCGQPLPCGNHVCEELCHVHDGVSDKPGDVCMRQCEQPRPSHCSHECDSQGCHAPPCPICTRLVRMQCHCKAIEKYFQCFEVPDLTEEQLSCPRQCIKVLECGHRCRKLCHSGECTTLEVCSRKKKVYCPCKNIKKEVPCNKTEIIACDNTCQEKERVLNFELSRKEQELKSREEERNRQELAKYEMKFGPKKSKQRKVKVTEENRSWMPYVYGLMSALIVIFIAMYLVVLEF